MEARTEVGGVRLAELMGALSYAADLGLGQPIEHCMRQTVIALRLADRLGADAGEREATYYVGMWIAPSGLRASPVPASSKWRRS